MEQQLYYHKCDDCLTPFSSTEKKVDMCDCNGSVTFMGVVHGDKFVKTENRAPCDGRCTHAHGPSCDCKCGGANHGTGRLVQVVVHEGKIKAVGLSEQDIEKAHMFRDFKNYAERLFSDKHQSAIVARASGIFVDRADYISMVKDRRELDDILGLRVYDRRHKKLAQFIIANKSYLRPLNELK